MPFIHDIGLVEEGIYQNWYPENNTFIVRDNHSTCSYSIHFGDKKELMLPPADQNTLYCLTVPLRMRVKATLIEHEGEPYKVRLTEMVVASGEVEVESDRHKERARMYFQEQSVQQGYSNHQGCHL